MDSLRPRPLRQIHPGNRIARTLCIAHNFASRSQPGPVKVSLVAALRSPFLHALKASRSPIRCQDRTPSWR